MYPDQLTDEMIREAHWIAAIFEDVRADGDENTIELLSRPPVLKERGPGEPFGRGRVT